MESVNDLSNLILEGIEDEKYSYRIIDNQLG
jgi:hypothetical protein